MSLIDALVHTSILLSLIGVVLLMSGFSFLGAFVDKVNLKRPGHAIGAVLMVLGAVVLIGVLVLWFQIIWMQVE